MVSVVCEGAGKVTSGSENKPFYLVDKSDSITLNIVPNTSAGDNLKDVKVDGQSISTDGLVDNGYTFSDVTGNHVIEVTFKKEIPATQKTIWWFHYQGEPVSFYTQHHVYKFYDLPYLDKEVPREDYTQTLLDKNGQAIDDDEIILPGNYDVRVTHPGDADYAAMDVIYREALQLAKCPGTPGRPVVYGKVGCTQGDLVTTSALQDYYDTDGKLIDAAHDEIPVTLVWLEPETEYNTAGNFYASATIYAANELDQRLKDCYTLDDGTTPLTEGCLISSRATQVVVLPADQASLIKVQASDASGGTVSGKGVYKNGETVTVTATVNASAGYTFGGWQENGQLVSGDDATYTFTADGDRTLTAVFEVDNNYRVTLQTDPADTGTVTSGGSYKDKPGHEATVRAAAKPGYYFKGWYEGENQKSTENPYTFPVEEKGITLTAEFGIDYLSRAEQAKKNFASAVSTDAFEWQTLVQAVDAYEKAKDFVATGVGSTWADAGTRFNDLTDYYSGVEALDLSGQSLDNDDLAKLYLFTGVTDLNLSGNQGVTSLTGLPGMALETLDLSNMGITDLDILQGLSSLETLETLDISDTGVTALGSLIIEDCSTFPGYITLTAQNLSLTSLSALAGVIEADGFSSRDIVKWDFSGSILTVTEENRADVDHIKGMLEEKFTAPAIQDEPTIPEDPEPVIPAEPVNPGDSSDGDDDGYSVSVPASSSIRGGAITVSPRSAGKGDTITITVKPDAGYELDELTVTARSGGELALTSRGNGRYTFTMPVSSVKI